MPISPIILQRRHAELGRIRLGAKVATQSGKTRPGKLEKFRFTSPSKRYITDLATLYGGTAREWDNSGKAEWEVYSEATSIPVIAVKGGMTQWMEQWSGGGCTRRCSGEFLDPRTTDGAQVPCICDAEPGERACKATTRLSVLLPELEAVGVWRLESHGWNAAAELPMVSDVAAAVGDLVPAWLNLVKHRAIKDGKTSIFVVPVLDLQVSRDRLREIAAASSGSPAAIGGSQDRTAIEAPAPDYLADLGACDTVECCRELWSRAQSAGHMTEELSDAIKRQAERLQPSPDPTPSPVSDEPVDAEVVDDGDKEALWQQLVAAAGKLDIGMDELQREVESNTGHTVPDATAADMQVMLSLLTTGEVKS